MSETTKADFSSFESKLSPSAFACFNELIGNARERILRDGPQPIYEAPLAEILETCGVDNAEAVAQSIRDILQCRVELKKGEYLYFFPFFASVAIERGMIRYSLPPELHDALSAVPVSSPT
jgi:hypothetical protein